jgi:hypothetical protein
LLVDRTRRLSHQPQVYGMQFMALPGKRIRFFDIVSPAELDDRRREIGLPPFYCWAHQVSRENEGASLEWPDGVLFAPQPCPGDG